MKQLRCCVIDSDKVTRDLVTGWIESTPGLVSAGSFNSAHNAIKTIVGGQVDVAYVAVELPEMSGFDFARIVPPSTMVVYLSDTPEKGAEAFRVSALDYLVKPLTRELFFESVAKGLRMSEFTRGTADDQRFIIVKSEYRLVQIPLDDILYVEGLKDYVKIYLTQDQKSVMSLMSVKLIELYLPSSMFMRVHRSYIINLSHIKSIERNRMILGSHNIPIGDSYRPQLNAYIDAHTASLQLLSEN